MEILLITYIVRRSDDSGQSGLQYAAQVVMRLLDPLKPETSAAFVDKLIIVFVRKVSVQLAWFNVTIDYTRWGLP